MKFVILTCAIDVIWCEISKYHELAAFLALNGMNMGFPMYVTLTNIPTDNLSPVKPQLQIRAGAEKSMDTREIINRYRKLGITRSILRCAVAVAMLILMLIHCTDRNIHQSEYRV